jgi:membrane-bound inhibitor of C-type lysozyme
MRWILFIVIVSLLPMVGCVNHDDPTTVAVTRYECDDAALTVRWAKDFADVHVNGNTYRLARAISASGARYADEAREIWEHQGALSWTDEGAARVVCKRVP